MNTPNNAPKPTLTKPIRMLFQESLASYANGSRRRAYQVSAAMSSAKIGIDKTTGLSIILYCNTERKRFASERLSRVALSYNGIGNRLVGCCNAIGSRAEMLRFFPLGNFQLLRFPRNCDINVN